jgi:hypothetical protein
VGGFGGNLLSGFIADKYESVNNRSKSFVATAACLINIPICLCLFLTQFSFYFAMTLLFLKYVFADGWLAPCLAIIQTIIEVKYKAVAIGGLYLSFSYISAISSMVTGYLITKLDIGDNFQELGYFLCFSTVVPSAIASFCFYRAGLHYKDYKIKADAEKTEAMRKASDANIELRSISI